MKEFNTTISGITCKACVMLISMELEENEGIGKIHIEESGKASISYDQDIISREKIVSIIKKTGNYTPQE